MTIHINGDKRIFSTATMTIADLLTHLNITQKQGLAVAQNQNLIRRNDWSQTPLQDGDVIEILQATAGG